MIRRVKTKTFNIPKCRACYKNNTPQFGNILYISHFDWAVSAFYEVLFWSLLPLVVVPVPVGIHLSPVYFPFTVWRIFTFTTRSLVLMWIFIELDGFWQVSVGYFIADLGMILWLYPSLGGVEYVSLLHQKELIKLKLVGINIKISLI